MQRLGEQFEDGDVRLYVLGRGGHGDFEGGSVGQVDQALKGIPAGAWRYQDAQKDPAGLAGPNRGITQLLSEGPEC